MTTRATTVSQPLQVACALNQAFASCAVCFDGFVQVIWDGLAPGSATYIHGAFPWVSDIYPVGESLELVGIGMKLIRNPMASLRLGCREENVLDTFRTIDSPSGDAAMALSDLNRYLREVVVQGGYLPFPLPGPGFNWSGETDTLNSGSAFRCTANACQYGSGGAPHMALVARAIVVT